MGAVVAHNRGRRRCLIDLTRYFESHLAQTGALGDDLKIVTRGIVEEDERGAYDLGNFRSGDVVAGRKRVNGGYEIEVRIAGNRYSWVKL